MSKRAKFCKCKGTYTVKGCNNKKKCKQPYYWNQGIGFIGGKSSS